MRAKGEDGVIDFDRKTTIANVAERLFSQHGFDGVSIRDIADAAAVNSALIRYYFGTKLDLYRSLFVRRYADMTNERQAALRALRLEPGSVDSLRCIVRVWAAPLLTMAHDPDCHNFVALLSREASDSGNDPRGIYRDYLDPPAKLCVSMLGVVMSNNTKEEVVQAYLWLVAAMSAAVDSAGRASRLGAKRASKQRSIDSTLARLEIFVSAGLLALSAERSGDVAEAGKARRASRAHG